MLLKSDNSRYACATIGSPVDPPRVRIAAFFGDGGVTGTITLSAQPNYDVNVTSILVDLKVGE